VRKSDSKAFSLDNFGGKSEFEFRCGDKQNLRPSTMADNAQPPPTEGPDTNEQIPLSEMDDLLQNLVQISIELGEDDVFQLFALPETTFHKVTSSSNETVVADGTGTRPYSASIAFLHFIKAFGHLLDGASVIELGGGIGACGLYLAHRQRSSSRIVITDGEPIAVEIAKRNRSFLNLSQVDIRRFLWSTDPNEIRRQLVDDENDESLQVQYVIGTDLLYYKTDAVVLMATIDALLAKDGVAFLPGIVRSLTLPDQLVQAASKHGLEITTLQLELFVDEPNLESIVSWYNIQFLTVVRRECVLPEALKEVLESVGQKPFDPNASDSE